MKILVVCQHYWPEPFNTTEVCETLVKRGHEVTVLTGLPNTGLPGNNIPKEYRNKTRRHETRNGVQIERAWLWPRKSGVGNRICYYLSFWYCGNRLSKKIDDDFDVVLGYQFSPITQVDPAVRYSERTGKPFLLYSFDLWPESLVAGGIGKKSFPFKYMKKVSARIYRSADTLAATSPGFFDYFRNELGVKAKHELYLPQYAEDLFGSENSAVGMDVARFDEGKIHFVFAGNVGKAQSVQTIIEAAKLLDGSDAVFHVVGTGSALTECRQMAEELGVENVVFHGRHPLEEMPAYYNNADAMLATLAGSPLIGMTLPRKVQTYLAASKPVIGTLEGEGRRVIQEAKCGFSCDAEDAKGLADACRRFMDLDTASKRQLGRNARDYYEKHYSKELFYNTLERELSRLKGTRHGV